MMNSGVHGVPSPGVREVLQLFVLIVPGAEVVPAVVHFNRHMLVREPDDGVGFP